MEHNKHGSPVRAAFQKLFQNKLATICFVILLLEILMVALAPVIAPYGYDEQEPAIKLHPGFWAQWTAVTDPEDPEYDEQKLYIPGHYLGTDEYGRDVFSRLLYGGRVSLMVGFVSTAMGLVAGVTCGLLAGYYKRLDNPIMRIMDLLFTFPGILLAMLIIAMLGVNTFNAMLAISIWSIPSFARMVRGKVLQVKEEDYGILLAMLIIAMLGVNTFNAMLAISIWSIPSFARMVRGKVLQVKEEDYIMATRSLGAKDSRIIFIHILKNCLPVIIVIATMRMATSIISISTLSYLGMGVVPPQPEWGGMIAAGKKWLWDAPSLIFVPGIAVMITVICFNILGDKLRDILDPSLKD